MKSSVILIFITVLLYTLILPKYKNAFIINNIKVKVTKSSLYHNCLNSDSSIVIVIKFTKEYISTSSAQRDLFLVADSKERGLEGLLNDDFEINFSIKKAYYLRKLLPMFSKVLDCSRFFPAPLHRNYTSLSEEKFRCNYWVFTLA